MTTIKSFQSRLQQLNIAEQGQIAIEETSKQLIAKQQDQMLHGLNALGEKIGEYRNEEYATEKHTMNPMAGFGFVDLRNTGAYFDGMEVNVFSDSFIVESTDEKASMLQESYGNNIIGLSKDYKAAYVQDDLKPVYLGNVKQSLKL